MRKLLSMITIMLFCGTAALAAEEGSPVLDFLNQETGKHIQELLEKSGTQNALLSVSRLLSHGEIIKLYRERTFLPVWIDGWQLKAEAQELLEVLRDAGTHGLCGNDYLLAELEGLVRIQVDFSRHNLPLSPDNRAVLDLLLSQAFLTYATHMVEGQVDPSLAHVDWRSRRRKADLVRLLDYATGNHRLPQVLEDLVPPHEEYRQLMRALSDYQRLAALGGWPVIPTGPTIRPGDRDDRVPQLRTLLRLTGDLAQAVDEGPVFDPATVEAMRAFQSRHGLVDDGVLGPKTLEELNVPVEVRIRQIELNLERWRWMPKNFGRRHIRVNVADFSLAVVEEGKTVLKMPVIVGTRYRKTPVFSANMTYLEFAPYWTVPPTILREDKLPQIKVNPAYLAEKHFQVISRQDDRVTLDPQQIDWEKIEAADFPGLLRMDPGPWNPLGRVKFMFPNQFNVYLHDTNEAYLFGKNVRSFSSGCIRIKRPRELAAYLLEKDLGQERLRQLFEATAPEQVSIDPLPVHVQYWTAWVDPEGLVHFRPDVYYRDLDLDIALTEPAYRVLDQLKVSSGMRLAVVGR